jgi:hypothetical protein
LKEAYDKNAPAGQDPNKPGEAPAPKPLDKLPPENPFAEITLDKLQAPEGYEIDPVLGQEFLTLLQTKHSDPNGLVAGLIELSAKANQLSSEKGSEAFDAMQAEWEELSKKDPEIGGANYDKNLATSKRIVDHLGGPKLQEALELTGMGQHPEFLRLMTKVAPFVTEASPVVPGAQPTKAAYSSTDLYAKTT